MVLINLDSDAETGLSQRRRALFWGAAVHELNTPLAVLQNYTEYLAPYLSGPEVEGRLAVMRRGLARLAAVIDDLGWRSALESGTLSLCLEPLDVERLLPEVALAAEAQHLERPVVFCYDGRLPRLHSDPNHLRHILEILLHNAAGYASHRCPTVEVEIRLEGDADLIFRVQDNAPKLWLAYSQAVFEPFPDLPPALGRPKFGLGLRLYAAREVARRMGGDLWVERPKGRRGRPAWGNAFVLRLPLAGAEKNA
jgi:signal transduction histidine kinase